MNVGNRRAIRGSFALAALAAVPLLAGCQKPLPTITVYGDGRSIIVDAAAYQFPGGPTHRPVTDYDQAPTLSVQAGSDLLIDVPRQVADNAWLVAAFTLDASSNTTPLAGAGSAGAIRNQYSTRVSSTPAGVGSYYLQVVELRQAQQVGGWVVHIQTTS